MKKLSLVAASATFCALASATAQVSYWVDVNGATPGFGNITSSTWNATNTNWTTDSGGAIPTIAWVNNNIAIFNNTGLGNADINVGGNFTVAGMSKPTTGYSITLNGNGTQIISFLSGNLSVNGNQFVVANVGLTGTFTKVGNGVLQLSNQPATIAANITISDGTVSVRHINRAATSNFTVNAGALDFTHPTPTIANLNGAGGVVQALPTIGNNVSLTVNQNIDGTYAGAIVAHGNASNGFVFGLIKNGTATLTLAGNNTYEGGTVINAGVLQIGNGTDSGSINTTSSITNNATLRFDVGGGNRTVGVLVSGTGAFTKNGTGTVTLSANNTYSGATTVNAGTLLITGNMSGATGAVTVASGATLGGNGTVGGAVTVQGGGILAPGTSPGTLTINNSLTLAGTSILAWQINISDQTVGGGINDLVTGVTNLTLDGTINFSLIGGPQVTSTGTWRLFNYSGTLIDNTLSIGTLSLASGLSASIDTSIAGQVNLNVIPEPSTWALLAAGLTTLVIFRRRR